MKRLIIVEDDADILETMTIILRNAGYLVTGYFDASAILKGTFDLPDLFIIDKQLNRFDNLNLCRILKTQESTRHVPVIMVSAGTGIAQLAQDALADDALEKPFKMAELKEIVAKHLS